MHAASAVSTRFDVASYTTAQNSERLSATLAACFMSISLLANMLDARSTFAHATCIYANLCDAISLKSATQARQRAQAFDDTLLARSDKSNERACVCQSEHGGMVFRVFALAQIHPALHNCSSALQYHPAPHHVRRTMPPTSRSNDHATHTWCSTMPPAWESFHATYVMEPTTADKKNGRSFRPARIGWFI